jgi:hypothetical protein
VDGLILACRAISMTHDAYIQFRMQRDMQRIGEAAGIAAALSVSQDVVPRDLDVGLLQAKLLESGALGERRRLELPAPDEKTVHMPSSVVPRFPARPIDEWLQELGGEDARDAIWPLYRSGEEALPALTEMAKEMDTREAFWASTALAMMDRPEAAPALVNCVQERREDLAGGRKVAPAWHAALVLLGRAGNASAVPTIADVLEDRSAGLDPLIAAVQALGRIGDPAAIPAIEKFLERDDLPLTHSMQVSYMRTLESRTQSAPDVSSDARFKIELAAAEALARLGSPRPDIVARYLSDDRAHVRRYAQKVQQTARVVAEEDQA